MCGPTNVKIKMLYNPTGSVYYDCNQEVRMPEKQSSKTIKRVTEIVAVPRSIQVTMLVALVGGVILVRPFIGTILFSALIAFIFNPVYQKILKKTKSNGLAITGTLFAAALSVIIPILFVAAVTVTQASSIINRYTSGSMSLGTESIQNIADNGIDRVNTIITALPGGDAISVDKAKVTEGLRQAGLNVLEYMINLLTSLGTAFFGFISTSILAIFLIMAMLRYQNELMRLIKRISPYDEGLNNIYLTKAGIMTKAMVKGQFIIAVAQGIASALSLWFVGLDYFWFLVVLLTFMSFIPLGAGILTIPIGGILILTGNIWQGIFIIVFHVTVVSFIDNLLRPHLVPKAAALNTALMLLAVFSGMALFGIAGIILGPVLMILIVTTFNMYADHNAHSAKVSLYKD